MANTNLQNVLFNQDSQKYLDQKKNTLPNKWYSRLIKSPLSPPNYVFGIVWPILYLLLAVSFYLTITSSKCVGWCKPIPFFIIQLVCNLSWTTVFFRLQWIRTAFVLITIIILFTLLTFYELQQVNPIAGYLLIPYLLYF